MREITIRKLRKEDLPLIEPLLRSMWLNHPQNEPEFISQEILENIDISDYFKKAMEEDNEFALVAEKDGKLAGIIRVEKTELEDFFRNKKAYFLDDIVVKKEHRKQGIAGRLFEEVERIAKENNVEVLKTRSYHFNIPAQNWLRKHGMKPLYSEYFKKCL